jgi:hypothetical protein
MGLPAKLAWWYLYIDQAGGRPARLATTRTQIACSYGRDTKSARRAIQQLEELHLVRVVDNDEARGTLIIELAEPADVLGAPGVRTGNPQRELFESSTAEVPAKVPAVLPAPYQDQTARALNTKYQDQDSNARALVQGGAGKSAGKSADPDNPGPTRIGELLGHAADAAQRHVEQQAQQLIHRVDEQLHPRIATRVAEAADEHEHGLRWSHVAGVIHDMEQHQAAGTLRTTRAQYFHGAMKRIFAQRSITW